MAAAFGWFALWIAGSLAAAFAVRLAWTFILLPIARRTPTQLDGLLVEHTQRPAQWVVATAGLNMGRHVAFAGFPQVTEHAAWSAYGGLVYALLVFSIAWAVGGALRAVTEWYSRRLDAQRRTPSHDQFVRVFGQIGRVAIAFVALTVIFGHFGIQVTGLLATAGVASLAFALAAQDTLGNLFAGFALMVDRPFQAGDRVELADGRVGDVLEIGMRTTRLLSFDNTVITLPNAEVAKNRITNYSAPNARVNMRATIGVAYESDLRRVKAFLLDVMQGHPEVLKDPPPAVYFTEFGASALNLVYVCSVPDYRNQFRIRDELNMAIKDRFDAEGVRIPYPQQDVHVFTGQRPGPA